MRRIGQYQVFEEIGRGGGGVVYRAQDPAIGRQVAIKELSLSQLAVEEIPEARQRFVREAQAVGNLRHENIVTLYQFIEEENSLYLVMEFVPGGSLQKLIRGETPPTAAEALAIVRQIAAALDHAHASGILHRDIKPANILVSDFRGPTGPKVKVTDFGIARMPLHTMTSTGVTLGTPAYMAPEQIMGSKVDAKADQFSLAVLAYQLLGHKLPFNGPGDQAVMFQIVNTNAASLVGPGLPREADQVIQRALAKPPAQRFPSCGSFSDALKEALFPPAGITRRTIRPNSVPAGLSRLRGRWPGFNKALLASLGALLVVGALYVSRAVGPKEDGGPQATPGTSIRRVPMRRGEAQTAPAATSTKASGPEVVDRDQPKQQLSGKPLTLAPNFEDSRAGVWRVLQTWLSYIQSGDIAQYGRCYADRLTRFYGKADVPVDFVVQTLSGEVRKYPAREVRLSNPSFHLIGADQMQVDYDKSYRFSDPGVRVNQGEVKSTQRFARESNGAWKITAEFDRKICWSTQMRNPALQSPPGDCR